MIEKYSCRAFKPKISKALLFCACLGLLILANGTTCGAQQTDLDAFPYEGSLFAGGGIQDFGGHQRSVGQAGASIGFVVPNTYAGFFFEGGYVGTMAGNVSGSAIFSANYEAQWARNEKSKFLPFTTLGYTRLFGSGNAVNFGGGVDYKVDSRHALRFEVRDYYMPFGPSGHSLAIRIGWVVNIQD